MLQLWLKILTCYLASSGNVLQVLHCVMYPWVNYDLPILCMDLVAKDGVVSLGIIDPCPVSIDRALSPAYVQICTYAFSSSCSTGLEWL